MVGLEDGDIVVSLSNLTSVDYGVNMKKQKYERRGIRWILEGLQRLHP